MKKFKVMIYVYSIKFIKSGMIILRFVGFFQSGLKRFGKFLWLK